MSGVFANLRSDLPASVVVFLVAMPLCMGIAIASGVPPALGLITGIVGGIVVGVLQGSPLQVSGPAAGLVVVIVDHVQKYGLENLGLIVGGAGLIQVVAGLNRGGRWFRAVPPSVVYGMLAGIGALIFLSQFHVMIDDKPRSSGIANLIALPGALVKAVAPSTSLPHREAALVGVATIVSILLWSRFSPRQARVFLPAPLMGVLVGTVLTQATGFPIALVDVPASLIESVNTPSVSFFFPEFTFTELALASMGVAIVASAETLLCASAVDRMHAGPRTNYNRELVAQGVGNLVCGGLGALPMTGVIVRSGANVQAGAKTRLSAILHGIWILVLVGMVPFALSWIPVASLAAVLVYTGAKLASPAVIRQLRPYGTSEVVLFLVTLVAVVSTDLLTGVMIGFGLAIGKLLLHLSQLDIHIEDDPASKVTVMRLSGSATFLRLADVAEALQRVPDDRELHLHFDRLEYVDHAILEVFHTWEDQHRSAGGHVVFDWQSLEERYHFRREKKGPSVTHVEVPGAQPSSAAPK